MAKSVRRTTTSTTTSGGGTAVATRPTGKASPTPEQIRARAFEIFLARGATPGDPVSDWVQAERELTQPSGKH